MAFGKMCKKMPRCVDVREPVSQTLLEKFGKSTFLVVLYNTIYFYRGCSFFGCRMHLGHITALPYTE